MKKAPKLTDAERSEIGILLSKEYSHRDIARVLGRSPNTISDEVRRNSVRGVYKPASAKIKSYLKRKYAKYQGKKIQEDRRCGSTSSEASKGVGIQMRYPDR